MTRLSFERKGRSRGSALGLTDLWLCLLGMWVFLSAAEWMIALLFLVSLPAALDFARGRRAWLSLDDISLRWGSGRCEGEVALARIDHIRLETRLDLSVCCRIVPDHGPRILLPQDCLPPPRGLEQACQAAGVRIVRHHFGFL